MVVSWFWKIDLPASTVNMTDTVIIEPYVYPVFENKRH